MARVMIVDDDAHIRELVSHVLRRAGFELIEAADGREALAALETRTVDCAILDVMMPGMDGWDLCRTIREVWSFPLLMLTAKGETVHKVKGLTIGADDYLVKPFETEELLARVRALLRRSGSNEAASMRIGRITADRSSREVVMADQRMPLPLKELDLLLKLASRPGTTFSRDAIIEDVWGLDFEGTERTVDVHVNRLRDRLPEERCGFRIVTIRGVGYRLETTT